MTSLFLTTSTVQVWRTSPVEYDTHGWAVQGTRQMVGSYEGNVQERLPISDPRASEAGGDGPLAPAVVRYADIYLEQGADVQSGDLLTDGVGWWAAQTVRDVPGPLAPVGAVRAVDAIEWQLEGD